MKQTQKLFALLLACIAGLQGWIVRPEASGESFSWYCVHAKNHEQPKIADEMKFIEDYNGYYIDPVHRLQSDGDKVIYLTFDAGYENGNVSKILDVLKEEQVTGCFFILANLIRRNRDLVERMLAEGHTVGNHTVHHKDMSRFCEAEFLEELRSLEDLFQTEFGQPMSKYYRPPEGRFSRNNMESARKNGYFTIFWSFAYADWDNNKQPSAEKAKQMILENLHNGEIMLLHPTSAVNAEILGDVIRQAKQQGYRFGSLDELTGGGHETK